MNDPSHPPIRLEVVRRATRLRKQFPSAPIEYFAHSLAYEVDLKPEQIRAILESAWDVGSRS